MTPAPKNILLIRLKSIGDVVFTLPAVNVVRDNFPSAKISFLTSKENAPLLAGFHGLDEIIPLDRAAMRSANPLRSVPQILGLLRRLRAGKFDLVVDFQGYGETAWLTRLTGARQRWGSVYRAGSEWAYTLGVHRDDVQHHAERSLAVLEAGGLKLGSVRNEFILPETSLADARAWLAANKIDAAAPLIYFQPFTSTPHKNWPFENYLALAKHWRERGVQIIMGGGPADRPFLEQARQIGCAVPERLPRLTDAGLMKLSTLVVGGDTGFLHLAVALGCRVVMLVEPAVSANALPFRHPDWAVAPPPRHPIAKITFEKVVETVGAALAEVTPKNLK
jgi:ADP-heptose:LPS heptosyltransferase